MEGFSLTSDCSATSYGGRLAEVVAFFLTVWSISEAIDETRVSGGGYRHYETWVRRLFMVAFAGLAGAGADLRLNAALIGTFGGDNIGAHAAGSAEALFPLVVALGSVVIIALLCALAARIALKRDQGATRGTFLAHPRIFAFGLGLLALLFVFACLFASRSITGSANADALERRSRVVAVAQIGSLLILALLVVQSVWARAKRRKTTPPGQVSNRIFAGTMIIIGAASLLLALYTYVTIRELWGIAMSG